LGPIAILEKKHVQKEKSFQEGVFGIFSILRGRGVRPRMGDGAGSERCYPL